MGTEAEALKVGGGGRVCCIFRIFGHGQTTRKSPDVKPLQPDPTASCVGGSVSESNYLGPKEWSCKKKQCVFDPRVSM